MIKLTDIILAILKESVFAGIAVFMVVLYVKDGRADKTVARETYESMVAEVKELRIEISTIKERLNQIASADESVDEQLEDIKLSLNTIDTIMRERLKGGS